MLAWFKQIRTPAPSTQSPNAESETTATATATGPKIERLVERLETFRRPTTQPSTNQLSMGSAPTRVIVVASQKGGTGKTTIAAHLAVEAATIGQGPAVLIDTDPQGSLSDWWDAREDQHAHCDGVSALTRVKLDDLTSKLAELRGSGAPLAIVDTPPAHTTSIEQAIALADLILIPVRPSPHDLRAVGATVNMVRLANKPYLFIINGAVPRANITAEAIAALSEHGQVVPVILYQRTNYASSMIDGRTVMETAAPGRSAEEVAHLWKYLHRQISLPAAA